MLVELLVVMGIITALVVQSVFWAHRLSVLASERQAQANIRGAFEAARVYYSSEFAYTADPAQLERVEPAYGWQDSPLDSTSGDTAVFVAVADGGQTLVLATRAEDRCFFLRDAVDGGSFAVVPMGGACAEPPLAAYGDSWV
jgi:hypothetical protein